jgi:hypothetical protein
MLAHDAVTLAFCQHNVKANCRVLLHEQLLQPQLQASLKLSCNTNQNSCTPSPSIMLLLCLQGKSSKGRMRSSNSSSSNGASGPGKLVLPPRPIIIGVCYFDRPGWTATTPALQVSCSSVAVTAMLHNVQQCTRRPSLFAFVKLVCESQEHCSTSACVHNALTHCCILLVDSWCYYCCRPPLLTLLMAPLLLQLTLSQHSTLVWERLSAEHY